MAGAFSSSSDVDPDNPWPGLYPYTEDLAAYFHGRAAECDELLRRVRQKSLTVLFGQSGLGKSSLIRAGLFPRLRAEDFRPIVIRFAFGKDAIGSGESNGTPSVIEQCRRQFAAGLSSIKSAVENESAASGPELPQRAEAVRDYFRRAGEFLDEHRRPFVPVLVFDQFEELFTRGSETAEGREEVGAFLSELVDLVEDPAAGAQRFRVLIALREDYLAFLESWRGELPSLVENRMRLTPLDGQGALRAVTRPAALRDGREPLVGAAVSRQIVRYLAGGGGHRQSAGAAAWEDFARFQVDPALLSLVLRELNDRRRERQLSQMTPELLRETGEVAGILGTFYDRTVADEHPAVRVLVEDQLLTDGGYRDNVSVERARNFLVEDGADPGAVDRLVERRLLRVEERMEQRRLELAHDVLCPILVERRAKRREEDDRRAAEETARQAGARADAAEAGRKKEAEARAEAERLRRDADAARRRARRFATISGIIAALAIAALIFALQAHRESEKERAEALRQQARATVGETAARSAKEKAVAAKKAADELINYMQYDLRDTLDALGHLKMMDGINARILKYQMEHPPDEGDLNAIREESVAFDQRGDVLSAEGQLAAALKPYRDSLTIRERLAKQDPNNADWQRDLSISYEKVGNILSAQGRLADALKALRDGLTIAGRLAKQDPNNAVWQRDLSVSYDRVGNALGAQDQLPDALKAYRDGLAIREPLAKRDPNNADWQRDLSISYGKVGDVLRDQGQLPGASKAYRDSFAICERLAKQNPDNADWQRDLSVSYDRVGDVLIAQGQLDDALKAYQEGFAICERLAKQDPNNAGWQRDLSVSYIRIGDVLRDRGQLAAALKAYRDSFAICERLAKQDPDNAGWQVDLSAIYDKVGNVLSTQGQLDAALKAYREAFAICERLAKQDPENAPRQNSVAWARYCVASVLFKQPQIDQTETARLVQEGIETISRLKERGPLDRNAQDTLEKLISLRQALNAASKR